MLEDVDTKLLLVDRLAQRDRVIPFGFDLALEPRDRLVALVDLVGLVNVAAIGLRDLGAQLVE